MHPSPIRTSPCILGSLDSLLSLFDHLLKLLIPVGQLQTDLPPPGLKVIKLLFKGFDLSLLDLVYMR